MEAIVKIDIRAVEIGETRGIHEKLNTFAFENMIIRLEAIKRHAILKTRATSALNEDAKFFFRIALT